MCKKLIGVPVPRIVIISITYRLLPVRTRRVYVLLEWYARTLCTRVRTRVLVLSSCALVALVHWWCDGCMAKWPYSSTIRWYMYTCTGTRVLLQYRWYYTCTRVLYSGTSSMLLGHVCVLQYEPARDSRDTTCIVPLVLYHSTRVIAII